MPHLKGLGCEVIITGRAGLLYIDHEIGDEMWVDSENFLTGKIDLAIRVASIGIWKRRNRPATEDERRLVLQKILSTLAQEGIEAVVE